jgi:hypothetical protein
MDFTESPVSRPFTSTKASRFAGLKGMKLPVDWKTMKSFLYKNHKVLAILAVAVFLFYWYEIRPIQMNNSCSMEASYNARLLLQNKAAVTTDPARQQAYGSLVAKDMYLRSDFESFYKKCMRRHGVNL